MRAKLDATCRFAVFLLSITVILPFLSPATSGVFAQQGNVISGYVFGLNRQPLEGLNVELLDDLSRTVARTRTSSGGHYIFRGMSDGRFSVRVMPVATDYEEQEQPVEIVNFTSRDSRGTVRTSGADNQQKDFYLKLRKGVTSGTAGALFAQDVPGEAKKLYDKAIVDLDSKREKEAFEALKSSLDIFPKYYAALERLGTEYVRLRYFDAAEVLLTIAVDVNPRGYKSWHGLAYSQHSLKKYAAALAAAQKAVELNSSSPEATFLLGVLLRLNKRYEEAEKKLINARDLSNDTMPRVHWELALVYGNSLKRYGDAARELKLFLKAEPEAKDAEKIRKLIVEFEAKAKGS